MRNAAITKKFPIASSSRREPGELIELPNSGLRKHELPVIRTSPKRWLAEPFQPITLKQLNAKAAMLERLDNKYVVREAALKNAVASLATHFDILEIGDKRDFTYETCYFDDPKHSSYFDHHQGRRQRCKVRVRKYTDAQLCFVEIKLKDKRGITVKKRLDYAVEKYGSLDASAWAHIHSAYSELYGREFSHALWPAIEIRYQRVTLVAKDGGERMTIDSNLVFSGADRSHAVDENAFIIETKSARGNGIADKILRSLHQHPTGHCSKYCVGAAILKVVRKHNNFLPALRKLNAVPDSQRNEEMVV